jgi:hypothetical protein
MTFDPTKALAKLGVAVAKPMTDLERANARSLRVSGKAAEEAKVVVAKREQAKQTLHEQYMANSTEYRRAYNTAIHAGALDINARARAVEAMREQVRRSTQRKNRVAELERDHAEKMATNPTYAERYNLAMGKGKTEKEARLVAMTYIRRLSKVEAGMCSNCCCRPKRDGLATCQRCADKYAAKHLRKYGGGVAYRGTATITTDTGLQFTIEYTATCKQGIAKSLSKAICAVMERAEQ